MPLGMTWAQSIALLARRANVPRCLSYFALDTGSDSNNVKNYNRLVYPDYDYLRQNPIPWWLSWNQPTERLTTEIARTLAIESDGADANEVPADAADPSGSVAAGDDAEMVDSNTATSNYSTAQWLGPGPREAD